MPQFIQSSSLSPIQGTAGQQQVIVQQGPTLGESISTVVQNTGNLVDTAGDIYASNRAQGLVEETIEQVDSARAAAERNLEQGIGFAEERPEGLQVSQDEWSTIQAAVANGSMTRERARLLASSRLRTRIAEQPLFADKLRKAASNVIGFNIESEGAQQYFASLPTQAQLSASSRQTELQKIEDEARALSATGETTFELARHRLVALRNAELNKSLIENSVAINGMSANEATSKFIVEDSNTAFDLVMGDVLAARRDNVPVDNVLIGNSIQTIKTGAVTRWTNMYAAAGGVVGSEDYNRQRSAVERTYDDLNAYVERIGVDNLTKQQLERDSRNRQLFGNQYFGKYITVSEVFGDETAKTLFNRLSRIENDSQRELILRREPLLKSLWDFLEADKEQFAASMERIGQSLFDPSVNLNETESAARDTVAKDLYDNATDASVQEDIVQGLAASNGEFKALSLMTADSPRRTSDENKTYATRLYQDRLPDKVTELSAMVERNPNLSLNIAEDGTVSVTLSQDVQLAEEERAFGVASEQLRRARSGQNVEQLEQANLIASQINLYQQAHSNGWSTVLGESRESYRNRLVQINNEAVSNTQQQIEQEATAQRQAAEAEDAAATQRQTERNLRVFNEVAADVEVGQIGRAQRRYSRLSREFPEQFPTPFDTLQAEVRRRAGLEVFPTLE